MSQLTITCRQFVLLHEYGHAALGHLNSDQTRKVSVRGKKEVEVREYTRDHLAEFAADQFAIDHALGGQEPGVTFPLSHFGLAAGVISRFFDLCEVQTQRGGKRASDTHPRAISRWLRLRKALNQAFGNINAIHPVDFVFDALLYEGGLPAARERDPEYSSLYQPGRAPILL